MLSVILLGLFLFPITWLISEAQERRWISIILGSLAIAVCSLCAYSYAAIQVGFSRNIEFTGASRKLIDKVIEELEQQNTTKVVTNLKKIQPQVYASYENSPRFWDLVDEFVDDFEESNVIVEDKEEDEPEIESD